MAWKSYLLVCKTILAIIDSKDIYSFRIFIPNTNNEVIMEFNAISLANTNNNNWLEKVYILSLKEYILPNSYIEHKRNT